MLQNYRSLFKILFLPAIKRRTPAPVTEVLVWTLLCWGLMGCGQVNVAPEQPTKNNAVTGPEQPIKNNAVTGPEYVQLREEALKLVVAHEPEKAIPLLEKAIALKTKEGKDDVLARLYGYLGYACFHAKHWAEAEEACTKGLEIASPGADFKKTLESDRDLARNKLKETKSKRAPAE